MTSEDPNKQISYLQQCLSSDKRPLGFFLGAGCPTAIKTGADAKEPLIPDIAGISRIVADKISEDPACKPLYLKVQDHFELDGLRDATVEDALTHIRGLRAVAGKDTVRGLGQEELERLDTKICQIIHSLADKALPNADTPFHHLASWVDAIRRGSTVEIFTTNYDLLMEQAFEDLHVPYFDGFAGVRKPFFDLRSMEEDALPPRWARLWKLHGSINWYEVPKRGVFRGTSDEAGDPKRVIHPSHLKYQESRRMPYLAMIDRMRAFLKQPTATLIVSGYSFRDEHLNEAMVQSLRSNQTAITFALLYSDIAKYSSAIKLSSGCTNLSLLAEDGAVISGVEAEWIRREAAAVPTTDAPWVKWIPADPMKPDGLASAKFALGDFAQFGLFLNHLVGSIRQSAEVNDVK